MLNIKWSREDVVVDQLRFDLKISCSERTRSKLNAAAKRFVQANYDTILALLAGSESTGFPFCITARRSAGKTLMSVSATGELRQRTASSAVDDGSNTRKRDTGTAGTCRYDRHQSQTNENSCEARMQRLRCAGQQLSAHQSPRSSRQSDGSFRACVQGEIRCRQRDAQPRGRRPKVATDRQAGAVLVEVMHSAEDSFTHSFPLQEPATVMQAAADPEEATAPRPNASNKAASRGNNTSKKQQQQQREQQQRSVPPLVADFYDTEARGKLFREKYSTLRGEYFIFYSHGESHCRKMLNAMGFKETPAELEDNRFRPVEKMAVMWCNGINSAAKRKGGLGYYIVNRLRYRGLITNKCSLSRCLKEFELNHPKLVPVGLEAASFYPDTIHLNGSSAFSIYEKIRSHRGSYLLKPGHSDCGNGIVLHRSGGSLTKLVSTLDSQFPGYKHKDLVMQRYVDQPLLLEGRKFDLRVYLLLVPNLRRGDQRGLYAFCHPGYARLACRPYQADSDDLLLHLTNQAIQQRDPAYAAVKEDTVWSPDRLNAYLNRRRRELRVPCADWPRRRLYPRIRAILAHVASLASSSLCDQPMSYELLGCDFLVDADFNVWLLELNSDPSLSKTTAALGRIVTQAVEESVGLAVEVLQRAARGQSIKRLVTRQDFRKIFSHTNDSAVRRVMAEAGVRYPTHRPPPPAYML